MNRSQAEKLVTKYVDGTATPAEKELVEYHFQQFLQQSDALPPKNEIEIDHVEIWKNLAMHIGNTEPVVKRFTIWPRVAAAAAVLLIAGASWLYFNSYYKGKIGGTNYASEIRPGHNEAILELANGKTINLSSKKTGVVINASNIAYNDGASIDESSVAAEKTIADSSLTTVRTPKGGMYQVVLSDGTKVWLNAASSLRFPANFAGKLIRTVELEGEGYFEVAKDKHHPFQVKSAMQQIEVLGTHFNIDGYAEDAVTKTSLLEGSVAVSRKSVTAATVDKPNKIILKPNQQSNLSTKGISVSDVDGRDAIAWKEGYFLFNNENLGSIMQRLSRWYDTKIVYEDESLKSETVYAKLSRYENINKILKLMEKTDKVRFRVDGNTITISRK